MDNIVTQPYQTQRSSLLVVFLSLGLIVLAVHVMVVGRSIYLPRFIALSLWFLVTALATALVKVKVPQVVSIVAAMLLLITGLVLPIVLIATNLFT